MEMKRHLAATVVTMWLVNGGATAADHLCPVEAPPPPHAAVAIARFGLAISPAADQLSVNALKDMAVFIKKPYTVQQQVNEGAARAQMEKALGQAPQFSAAEKQRQAQSGACNASYDRLLSTFISRVDTLPDYPAVGREGLAVFADWYFDPRRKPGDRQAAEAVVQAELAFEKACLVSDIPPEMNPGLIRGAVGVLSYDNQPFCSGFRDTDASIITARHCLVAADGSLQPWTVLSLAKQGALWFQYEAEPGERYQVCNSGLPAATRTVLVPARDNIRVAIAKTQAPPVKWKWSTLPLSSGAPLYLRGIFPFGDERDLLAHMRSTAFGGCAAFKADDRCVFHGCQTTPSMSGAPVFHRPDSAGSDELQVVGLHLGTAALSSPTEPGGTVCAGSDGRGFSQLNFAYQPGGL